MKQQQKSDNTKWRSWLRSQSELAAPLHSYHRDPRTDQAGQLYYSMTPESATGPYDLVWNWYDGSGRRFMTHLATSPDRGSLARPDSTVGFRTYYVYDGNDVAFTLVRPSTGTTWRIQQRSTDGADVMR